MKQDYSLKVRTLRLELGLTQHTLAERLRVRPQVVASWEQGRKEPSANSYQLLARLAPPEEAWFFLEKLGVTKELVQAKWLDAAPEPADSHVNIHPPQARHSVLADHPPLPAAGGLDLMVQIPILRDGAAGKHPSELSAGDIESFIAMPLKSAPQGAGAYTGIHIFGDAMKPTLCDSFIAVINHASREAAALAGRIVAVRLGDAVVVRRLAPQSGSAGVVLLADNLQHAEISIALPHPNPIIGDVVFWWGAQE